MSEYHEPESELSAQVRDQSRALKSLKEEVEAIDWYNQRVDAATNQEIAAIMGHNRDEEIEHACMALEWLRRNMPGWDEQLRTFLFTTGDLTQMEEGEEGDSEGGDAGGSDLGIGSLK
jgi:ferritin-like protein